MSLLSKVEAARPKQYNTREIARALSKIASYPELYGQRKTSRMSDNNLMEGGGDLNIGDIMAPWASSPQMHQVTRLKLGTAVNLPTL